MADAVNNLNVDYIIHKMTIPEYGKARKNPSQKNTVSNIKEHPRKLYITEDDGFFQMGTGFGDDDKPVYGYKYLGKAVHMSVLEGEMRSSVYSKGLRPLVLLVDNEDVWNIYEPKIKQALTNVLKFYGLRGNNIKFDIYVLVGNPMLFPETLETSVKPISPLEAFVAKVDSEKPQTGGKKKRMKRSEVKANKKYKSLKIKKSISSKNVHKKMNKKITKKITKKRNTKRRK